MRILLWAPLGSGEHYWGPGISAYRLYGSKKLDNVTIDLAHGFKGQHDDKNIFRKSFFIAELGKIPILSTLWFLLKSWIFVQKNHQNYDVVHCLGAFEDSFRPAMWFTKKGLKVYCKITDEKGGIVGHSRISSLLGVAKRRNRELNKIAGFIAISSEIVSILKNAGVKESKIFQIPNGVNVDYFKPPIDSSFKTKLRFKYGFKESDLILLFVGGLSSRKQPFELVREFVKFCNINSQFKNLNLVLLGPDRSPEKNLKNKIEQYVLNESLNENVKLFDYAPNPIEFYQLADAFVLPSLSEGMSNAVLEAQACGLPSIVTPVSGMRDLIQDNHNGFVTDLKDFPNKIQFYYKNPNILVEHSLNSRKYMEDNFATVDVLKKHITLFFNN